jgi:putative ABC transport system permease protein
VALFVMILRKMLKNKWLELGLLGGLIVSVSLASSMPIYTSAILERMLIQDLKQTQFQTGKYPGNYRVSIFMKSDIERQSKPALLGETDSFFTDQLHSGFKLPAQALIRERATDHYALKPFDSARIDGSRNRLARIASVSELEEKVRVVDGKLPAPVPVDGVYEAVVFDQGLNELRVGVGQEWVMEDETAGQLIRVRIVGVIEYLVAEDVYWHKHQNEFKDSLLVQFDLFEEQFTKLGLLNVRTAEWYSALDYTHMRLESISRFQETHQQIERYLETRYSHFDIFAQPLQVLHAYGEKEEQLRLMLWSLYVPVLILLGFYLFMVANLITDRQKTEIAVLRSRGASRLQIMAGYAVEGVLLGAVAYAIGPVVGLYWTKLLGASNGFLEFVQRAALDVRLSEQAYRYGLAAVLCSVMMTLIPAFIATGATIVGHKHQMARQPRSSVWHRFYIDIVLMGVAFYGLQTFNRRMSDMTEIGMRAGDMGVDPLLFLVPALFVLGLGLFILRIYPWFIRVVYWVGRRWWSPALYSALIQVGRRSIQYQFIMVFLIITVATGMFSASAARTIHANAEEKIRYAFGSDIRLQLHWESEGGEEDDTSKKIQYSEPPFYPLTQLEGVKYAAKVFSKDQANLSTGKSRGAIQLMGIEPYDFGQVAWLRDGLLDYHFYDYLNLLSADPEAALISRSVAEHFQLQEGDRIALFWDDARSASFTVFGIIDYWPSWNPNPVKGVKPMLVVGHLSVIQNRIALEPYEAWIALKPGATSQKLYDALVKANLPIEALEDSMQEIIRIKNDPFQLAINGVMTLGFLISMTISFVGFLIYWVLTLAGRILQFGIYRAMGISFRQLLAMIGAEQLLTSGAAVGIGLCTGVIASELFVPMFQLSFDSATQVPPFRVTLDPKDQRKMLWIVAVMISLGLTILGYMLSRIKIYQAVKLGED